MVVVYWSVDGHYPRMGSVTGSETGKKRDGGRELSWKAGGQHLIEAEVAAEMERVGDHCVKAALSARCQKAMVAVVVEGVCSAAGVTA